LLFASFLLAILSTPTSEILTAFPFDKFVPQRQFQRGVEMNNRGKPQSAAEKNAQSYFKKAEQDETTAKKEYKKAFAANATKTANLREQRLAKEAADAAELTDSKPGDTKKPD
jgi:hypothetical protein